MLLGPDVPTEQMVSEARQVENALGGPKCFRCATDLTDYHLCYGCKEYICDDCEPNFSNSIGEHTVWDHFICPCATLPAKATPEFKASLAKEIKKRRTR